MSESSSPTVALSVVIPVYNEELNLPALFARIILGEMADELLLASTRVQPAKLQDSRFGFQHRELESALREELAL